MGLFKWHENLILKFQKKTKTSSYQIAWISWFKGLVAGVLIYHFLLVL